MRKELEDLASGLVAANSTDAVWEKASGYFQNMGFAGAVYGVRSRNPRSKYRDIRSSDTLKDWFQTYQTEGDEDQDPLFSYVSIMPPSYFTGSAFLPDYPFLNDEDREVIHRAESFGWNSGVAMPMPSRSRNIVGGWNLMSELGRGDFQRLYNDCKKTIPLAAAFAHVAFENFEGALADPDVLLSPRERECLLWLAAGFRTAQIANLLNIRPVTVDLHIRNARTKLGARTREQALAIAITRGHIDP